MSNPIEIIRAKIRKGSKETITDRPASEDIEE
jgi:hypothetical protein